MAQNRKVKVAIETLGCKLNQAESEHLARELATAGYVLVSPSEKADIYVLNSCTVTGIADRKARQSSATCRSKTRTPLSSRPAATPRERTKS